MWVYVIIWKEVVIYKEQGPEKLTAHETSRNQIVKRKSRKNLQGARTTANPSCPQNRTRMGYFMEQHQSVFDLWEKSFSSRHSGVEKMIKYGLKSDPFLITELAIFEEQST